MSQDPLRATREAILREVVAATGATAAVLHERDELCRSYHQVARVGGDASRSTTIGPLAFRHPLITWLRVNHHPLPVPDRIGVYDELAETDRAALGAAGVSAAIPLSDVTAISEG